MTRRTAAPLAALITTVITAALLAAGPAHADRADRLAPLIGAGADAAPGQYLVRLQPGSTAADLKLRPGTLTHDYRQVYPGVAARLSPAQVSALRASPYVVAIEQASRVHATQTQRDPSWGLDRIDQRKLPLDHAYTYRHTGSGVTAYVIDSGIDVTNPDFGGRASVAYDATGGDGLDCNGHGTHVAGTIGGARYGVAKQVALRAVRVLDCSGAGTSADVIAALDWLAGHAQKPAVANMSLGGAKSPALDAAVAKLVASGVYVVVAAGNDGGDACAESPAGAPGVMTVAASDERDAAASFSNHGRCVEAYAPGVKITSDWVGGGTRVASGTSMAAPHVTGVAALFKSALVAAKRRDVGEAALNRWITGQASAGVIGGAPAGTPNRLLYTGGL